MKVRALTWIWIAVVASAAPVSAAAPAGRYTQPTPGTVRDARTQLTWQVEVEALKYNLADAKSHCDKLALDGSGWRLPTRAELLSLVDPTEYNPTLDQHLFPNTPTDRYFWSSTPRAGVSTEAWYVDFWEGKSNTNDTGVSYYVRCVR